MLSTCNKITNAQDEDSCAIVAPHEVVLEIMMANFLLMDAHVTIERLNNNKS